MTEPTFQMDADSLLSKWGFGDGDALDSWWWDNFDISIGVDTHELLYNLAVTYLVPKIVKEGHTIEIYRIHTNHNPVRAEILDGREVDVYRDTDDLKGIYVLLTRSDIESLMSATVIYENKDERKVIDGRL